MNINSSLTLATGPGAVAVRYLQVIFRYSKSRLSVRCLYSLLLPQASEVGGEHRSGLPTANSARSLVLAPRALFLPELRFFFSP